MKFASALGIVVCLIIPSAFAMNVVSQAASGETSISLNPSTPALNEPFTISASFYNLQFGWQLFFVITRLDTAESLILPDSLPIQNDSATGAVSVKAAVTEPGLYTVGVYIAATQEEIQRLQRWARAGFAVPPETQYNGVILFRDLMLFEAR